ncbi:MAG: SDR family oxidoreductase [Deltaproteobacteria bacterium]|nr:SDR family oxidoreductase [Deltaproteobacteria bacterium]
MIFITGFPGFIAGRLVRRLIEKDSNSRFVCLVEPRMHSLARKVAGDIDSKKIEIIDGDITQPDLGLSGSQLDRMASIIDSAFHLAAIYDLTVPSPLAWKVNVEGTRYVLDFLEKLKNLKRHGYFSTCYVAGLRDGQVYEEELEKGQKFKNFYESTKYEAEVLVRKRLGEIPTTVFRPSVVVGDSRTGEIPKFDGPYFAIGLIRRFRRLKIPLVHIGPSVTPINIVPVDFVVNSAVEIFTNEQAIGATCALADPNPPTSGELFETFCRLWDESRPIGHLPTGLAAFLWKYCFFDKVTGVPGESLVYFNHGVTFDTANTQRFIASSDVHCPSFKEYAQVMINYYREHHP